MESRVPWRGSQGHGSSDGTMGKLYLTKRFPGFTRPLRARTKLPTFSGCLGCALGECDLAGAYMSHPLLQLGKEEGVSEIHTKLASVPLSLGALLDLVIPVYAPQQMTTPLLDFCFSSPR